MVHITIYNNLSYYQHQELTPNKQIKNWYITVIRSGNNYFRNSPNSINQNMKLR